MLTGRTKGGGGSWEMLTMDEGEGGVWEMLTMADKGGRGVWTPQFLADIVCEQPFMLRTSNSDQMFHQ